MSRSGIPTILKAETAATAAPKPPQPDLSGGPEIVESEQPAGEYGGPQPGGPRHYTADGADGGNRGPPLGGQQFISYAQLEVRYGKSRVTLWRWVKTGRLPVPRRMGPNSVAFAVPEILEKEAGWERVNYAPAPEAA